MNRISLCTCGLLEKEARDSRKPIVVDEAGRYFLQLAPGTAVEIHACRLCGGYEKVGGQFYFGGAPCTCGALICWAEDPALPVEYDARINEYMLPALGLFYYCIVCGGRLPKSRRGEYFTTPTSADIADLATRTRDLNTAAEVIASLGPPGDDRGPIHQSPEEKANYGLRDIRRQLTYSSRWPSLTALFQEMEDGKMELIWSGTYTGRASDEPGE